MYELIRVAGETYYIQSPAKIGLVRLNEREVCLIDSGNDRDAGRKIRQLLDANGWKLTAIYHTHSNADHIGGSRYLQGQTGCRVYAPDIECAFVRHPILEPSFLYGGYPCNDLRHKFLLAQESDAAYLTADDLPAGFEMFDLPGHFFSMVGFRTPDDVVFLADCLSSRETLDKYGIGFIYDVGAYVQTLERVMGMQARSFVPSHAEATADIAGLAQYNIDKVRQIADRIVAICDEPRCFEHILQRLFVAYDLRMSCACRQHRSILSRLAEGRGAADGRVRGQSPALAQGLTSRSAAAARLRPWWQRAAAGSAACGVRRAA